MTNGIAVGWLAAFLVGGGMSLALGLPGTHHLEGGHLARPVVLGGLGVWALHVALLALASRRHSEPVTLVVVGGVLGLIGFPILGGQIVYAVNQRHDPSSVEERVVTVVDTSRHKGTCAVALDSWLQPGARESLSVSCSKPPHDRTGTTVTLRVHRGALGIAWVEPLPE